MVFVAVVDGCWILIVYHGMLATTDLGHGRAGERAFGYCLACYFFQLLCTLAFFVFVLFFFYSFSTYTPPFFFSQSLRAISKVPTYFIFLLILNFFNLHLYLSHLHVI